MIRYGSCARCGAPGSEERRAINQYMCGPCYLVWLAWPHVRRAS